MKVSTTFGMVKFALDTFWNYEIIRICHKLAQTRLNEIHQDLLRFIETHLEPTIMLKLRTLKFDSGDP